MQSIYIETTIPSYITARDSSNYLVLYRQITSRKFWEEERLKYDLYISQYVLDECCKGNPDTSKKRLDCIAGLKMLPSIPEVEGLAPIYINELGIPEKASNDGYHLAIAVLAEMDYVLSWNFSHMGAVAQSKLQHYNEKHSLKTPLLVTPELFIKIDEKEELK